ncbi:MAG: 3-isopropylmalate dehydrogenase [Parvularcula sp.]
MTFEVAVLPGDGVGPEVTAEAMKVVRAAAIAEDIALRVRELDFGGAAIDSHGEPLPAETLDACLKSDAVFLGAIGGPKWDHAEVRPEVGLLALRRELGVFANFRPVQAMDCLSSFSPLQPDRVQGCDILIVRELTGGLYFGERTEGTKAAQDRLDYSAEEIERVGRVAFEAARKRRSHVTSVDKANVLATSRLWRAVMTRLAKEYPDVKLDHVLVDAMAMHLIQKPTAFDVVVTENLFGDILSDETSVLSGSIGLLGSASVGDSHRGLYEPIHGSAPDIAGQGAANPVGAILSVAMMLRHSAGSESAAQRIERAVEVVTRRGIRTKDIGGNASCWRVGDAIAQEVETGNAVFFAC